VAAPEAAGGHAAHHECHAAVRPRNTQRLPTSGGTTENPDEPSLNRSPAIARAGSGGGISTRKN